MHARIIRLVITSAATLVATSAFAAADHWDRPSCYISMHNGCFNDSTTRPCTDAEYRDLLENCDTAYPNGGGASRPDRFVVTPRQPGGVLLSR